MAWYIRHLPPEAAIYGNGWSVTSLLISDLIHALTGNPHPSDPRVKEKPAREAIKAARDRSRERRQRLGIKGSVLRKG